MYNILKKNEDIIMGLFSKLFKKKEKVETPAESKPITKPSEAFQDAPKEVNEYLFEAGEKTPFDCIVEAKKLEFDMREVNYNYNRMKPREFMKWFENYKISKNKEKRG